MENDQEIRVLIADDHPIVRQGLRSILETEDGLKVVGEAANGEEAVTRVTDLCPDVVLMDIRMSRLDGLQATQKIVENSPLTKVIILTNYDEDELIYESTRVGAVGYLMKDVPPPRLVEAIKGAAEGYYLISPRVGRRMMGEINRAAEQQPEEFNGLLETLTPREKEVLYLMVKGYGNKRIAGELIIAEKTVKTHVSNIFSKLQVANRAEALAYVMQGGPVKV